MISSRDVALNASLIANSKQLFKQCTKFKHGDDSRRSWAKPLWIPVFTEAPSTLKPANLVWNSVIPVILNADDLASFSPSAVVCEGVSYLLLVFLHLEIKFVFCIFLYF